MFRWSCSDGPELIHELEMTVNENDHLYMFRCLEFRLHFVQNMNWAVNTIMLAAKVEWSKLNHSLNSQIDLLLVYCLSVQMSGPKGATSELRAPGKGKLMN